MFLDFSKRSKGQVNRSCISDTVLNEPETELLVSIAAAECYLHHVQLANGIGQDNLRRHHLCELGRARMLLKGTVSREKLFN